MLNGTIDIYPVNLFVVAKIVIVINIQLIVQPELPSTSTPEGGHNKIFVVTVWGGF